MPSTPQKLSSDAAESADPTLHANDGSGTSRAQTSTPRPFALEDDSLIKPQSEQVVALRRRESKLDNRISSLVVAQEWAMTNPEASQPSSTVDAMQMLVSASKYAKADAAKNEALQYIAAWPVGQRVQLELSSADGVITARTLGTNCALPSTVVTGRAGRRDETRSTCALSPACTSGRGIRLDRGPCDRAPSRPTPRLRRRGQ